MARTNRKITKPVTRTHEGGRAWQNLTPTQALRRSVLSCLLWEDEFYEEGESIADRITKAAREVPVASLASLAFEARNSFNLRHVPLLLLAILADRGRGSCVVSETMGGTIQRADELGEFLSIYAKANGVTADKLKPKLSAQVKKGLALAFHNFDAYQLAKYDRRGGVKLRDALFLCHAKPANEDQALMWKRLVVGTLEAPDTWEVALSKGADKKTTFERLLRENKLGYLALLRNLRNMVDAKCDEDLVVQAILARRGAHRVLPFRFVAAARAVPQFEKHLDQALCATIEDSTPLKGKTAILVDVSGSMKVPLSMRSDITRMDAGAVLASMINGDVRMFAFSYDCVEVPARRGMAGVDAIINSMAHGGTQLGSAVHHVLNAAQNIDRLVVITDEQSHDDVTLSPGVVPHAYLINVASNKHGVGYGRWVHIDGFSEQVLRFISEYENADSVDIDSYS